MTGKATRSSKGKKSSLRHDDNHDPSPSPVKSRRGRKSKHVVGAYNMNNTCPEDVHPTKLGTENAFGNAFADENVIVQLNVRNEWKESPSPTFPNAYNVHVADNAFQSMPMDVVESKRLHVAPSDVEQCQQAPSASEQCD